MNFKATYIKLTIFYVLVLMVISVSFSAVIYNISSREIGLGLDRQNRLIRDMPMLNPPPQDLDRMRLAQMDESNTRLKWNLFYCNLIILVLSSLLSYFFARRTVRPIEEAMEAQKRFTADASHELRTPLTVMRSEIEVALREKNMTLKEAKELLESNLKENEKLESLSNALLKLARYDEGPSKIFKEVSLPQVITRAYEKVETLATKKNIEFQNNLKEASIKGDQDSLAELFVILLDNAIKYSPKGGKIFVDIKRDKKKVIVIVRDRGIGINASHLPHIFDRFYRAESSRSKEKIDGYGLGLAIAKSIVDLHKGKIFAKSTPNKGSEFIVTL